MNDLEEFMDDREKRIAFAFMAIEGRKINPRKQVWNRRFWFLVFLLVFVVAWLLIISL